MALPFFSAANVQDTHIVLPRFYAVCSLDEYCGCLETQRELSYSAKRRIKGVAYRMNCAGCRNDVNSGRRR